MDTKNIAKAMAKCLKSKETQVVDNYRFEYVGGDTYRDMEIYQDGELIAHTSEVVYATTTTENLASRCEEKFGWIMLRRWAQASDKSGVDLYEYLTAKCVEEGISLDYLDKHIKDLMADK